jgi:hypothetical protein
MKLKSWFTMVCVVAGVTAVNTPTSADELPASRLNQIYSMSPEQMARTGAWTRANYDRMMAHIYSIKDQGIRELVVDMVNNPRSTVFDASAKKDSYRFSPAAGGPGHHHYPGGLPVHAVENIEVSLGWADAVAKVHGVENINRDIIIASLVLHDWAKVWYEWDETTGKVNRPEWFPAYWGGQEGIAKWKWMGGHGAIVYSELMARGAPTELVVATAAAHFDPYWDLDKADGKEGLDPALAEAAKLAKVSAPKVDPAKRMAEWWMIDYSDGSWSFSHYMAGKMAHGWIREVAKDHGIDPESAEANKLAMFVLTRVSDFKLYNLYQNAGFDPSAPKAVIEAVLKDSSAYEVPAT